MIAERPKFDAQDITIALSVALLAQLGFVAAFSLPSPKLVEAEISNDNAQPIAVSITPVLKLGSKTPNQIPSPWQRRRPVATKSETQAALPSPLAAKTPEAIPTAAVADAAIAPTPADSGSHAILSAPEDAGNVATAASTEGSELGAANGTETDPLKARAVDQYRAQLMSWFLAHFHIRGKVPFETLKTLHASTTVSVTADRKVGGFTVDHASGNATFDDEVQATLRQIQSSGVELPAPPPMYPDILRSTLPVNFACTVQKYCE